MQTNYVRTTITIPQDLLLQAKYYALADQTSISKLIQKSLAEKIKRPKKKIRSILDLAGTLNLKGVEPPNRYKLYEKHIKGKMGL